MNQGTSRNNDSRILIAIIGLIGTVLAAAIVAFSTIRVEESRQKAELTRIALVASITQGAATQESMVNINAVSNTAVPTLSSLPASTNALPTEIAYSPLPSDYISIKGYVGVVSSGGIPGNMTYSHLVTGKIIYERIEADDDVEKVELVCADNRVEEITNFFHLTAQPEGSFFANYASNGAIDIPENCRVDFTVMDRGGQTGITIRSSPVP